MSRRRTLNVITSLAFILPVTSSTAESNTINADSNALTAKCQVTDSSSIPLTKLTAEDEQLPLSISADKAQGQHQNSLTFSGNVHVSRGAHRLIADQATMDRTKSELKAVGDVHFQAPNLLIESKGLSANAAENTIEMSEATYRLRTDPTHGKAQKIEIKQKEQIFALSKGTFTTCPEGDNSWQIEAGRIELNGEAEWGSARNSVVKIAGVPIMWIPYMTFPITDKRKSGLLFPSISNSSRTGLDYKQPIYWNIAPNVDATFTPRYIGNSGLLLGLELRYLRDEQYNRFNIEYMPSDDDLSKNDKRYMYYWQHQGQFSENFRTHVEFTKVSDDNYFNDLGSEIASETENRLERVARISYLSDLWDLNFSVTDFEVFGDTPDVFRQLPRLEFTYRVPYFSEWVHAQFYSELTSFDHPDQDKETAKRYHLEPSITYNWSTPSTTFEAQAKLYQSFYKQEDPSNRLSSSVSRAIPSLKLNGQLNFERGLIWDTRNYTQTLEPQAQYLYVGHENQNDIGIYDTISLRDDVYSLFRDRQFSGIDRIADTHQITLGATTRLFNQHNQETLRFSFGQIFYLDDSKVIEALTGRKSQDSSAFATSIDTFIDDYSVHAELRYNFETERTEASNMLLNYTPGEGKLIQLSYRHSPEPIDFINPSGNKLDSRKVNQLGSVVSWPVTDQFQLLASHSRDIELDRSVETLLGLQYQSCCWAVRLVYQRNLNTNFPEENGNIADRNAYDAGIALQFELKGLGGDSDFSGHSTMIDKSVFGYRKNYYLNN